MLPSLKDISIELENKTSFKQLCSIFKSSLLAERMRSLCIKNVTSLDDEILMSYYSDIVIEQQCHQFHLRSIALHNLPNQMTNSILSMLPDKKLRYLEVYSTPFWYFAFSL